MADEKAAVPGGTGLPPELQTASASAEDKSTAMIAHLLGIVGFLGPLIIFLIKKDGASKFAQFHMKQSLFLQIAVDGSAFVLSVLGAILMMVFVGVICFPVAMLVVLGGRVYAIIGGITVNGGKDFEYKVVGPWVRKSL
jgi:uncharacterized Tic20 family protein